MMREKRWPAILLGLAYAVPILVIAGIGIAQSLPDEYGLQETPMGGTATSAINMNLFPLCFDADGNTCLDSDANDTVDFEIGGAVDYTWTANNFTAATGSQITVPQGSAAAPSIVIAGCATCGLYGAATDVRLAGTVKMRSLASGEILDLGTSGTSFLNISSTTTPKTRFFDTFGLLDPTNADVYYDGTDLRLSSAAIIGHSSNVTATGAVNDIGIERKEAGTYLFNGGSTTTQGSALFMRRSYHLNDANLTLDDDDCGATITTNGATADRTITLPALTGAVAAGGVNRCSFTIYNDDAAGDDVKVLAVGDDTIRVSASGVSGAAGFVCMSSAHDYLYIEGVSDTVWRVFWNVGILDADIGDATCT